jgi:7,8-dihydroneopterin aldolase/epimerase/oxygenase
MAAAMPCRRRGALMAIRSRWTIRVEALKTRLRVGLRPDERRPQPVVISLRISGLADGAPHALEQCLDYEPVCRWLIEEFPKSAHVDLIESRINEIAHHIFAYDKRVMDVWVGLYKEKAGAQAERVGLERDMSRRQHDAAVKKAH